MEKKLTNSGPLREPADKHSISHLEPLSLDLLLDAEINTTIAS